MKIAVIAAIAAALAGCASEPVPASQVADLELCKFQLKGGRDAMVAQQEAQRRGLDCRPYFPMLVERERAGAAQAAQALQYFNRPVEAPAVRPMGRCETRLIGNMARTDCF